MTGHPTRAVINLEALGHNLKIIRHKIGPQRRLLAVVKADAYGHGAREIATFLQEMGADMLGVAYTEEGLNLRRSNITLPILVMSGTLPAEMESALESNLILSISNIDMAKNLSHLASKLKCMAKIHIKVDTGMGRLGFLFEKALDAIKTIYSLPNVIVEGIFTHLSTAEEPDPTYTQYQIKLFRDLMNDLAGYLDPLPMFHMSNSAAVIQHPNTYFDMVRVGITLYGVAPVSALQKRLPIYPLLSFKTRVIHIKKVRKGSSLSYGRSYICTSDKVIAIIPVGYSDGLARCMSGKIHVLIKGVRVPVVGTVCMDMTLIDITGLEDIKIGEEVVLIGSQGKESITAHDWAAWQDTIPYEVLCAIGPRVTRIYQYDKVALSI